ncbi:MAG: glycosyltransferase family 4 protein [Acidobacteriota bacterium]
MRILMVNKFLYRRGGSEAVFLGEMDLLRRAGHTVIPFGMAHERNGAAAPEPRSLVSSVEFTSPRPGLRRRAAMAMRVVYSREAYRKILAVCRQARPQVAHLHNIAHHLSPSILHALARLRLPMVMTLHDYKVVCPAYTLRTGGAVCTRCRGGRYLHAIRRRCVGGSVLRSTAAALETSLHRGLLHSYDRVNRFLSPSRFLADTVREMGFPHPVQRLANFIRPEPVPETAPVAGRILYAGRLSPEKGIRTLLRAVQGTRLRLRVAGTGPLEAELREQAAGLRGDRVEFLGHLPPADLAREHAAACLSVVPSECYENQPLAVLESYAHARPVVAARIGGLPEIVAEGETGVTFPPGEAAGLRRALLSLAERPEHCLALGRRAVDYIRRQHSPEDHLRGLEAVYRGLVTRRSPVPDALPARETHGAH